MSGQETTNEACHEGRFMPLYRFLLTAVSVVRMAERMRLRAERVIAVSDCGFGADALFGHGDALLFEHAMTAHVPKEKGGSCFTSCCRQNAGPMQASTGRDGPFRL